MIFLKNKVILITGASGIAAATIKSASSLGAKIFYCGLERESCINLKNELKDDAEIDFFACDLTAKGSPKKLVQKCVKRFGGLDALFNVAGTSGRKFGDGALYRLTDTGWSKTLNSNLDTQYKMCQEAIEVMMRNRSDEFCMRGSILNMASILGVYPEPKYFSALAYATAKGAIITMTRHIASYYAKSGIRVNAIAPGLTNTKMSKRATTDERVVSFIKTKQPLTKGIIAAKDIADVALFLLSNQARIITGQTIFADGGWNVS